MPEVAASASGSMCVGLVVTDGGTTKAGCVTIVAGDSAWTVLEKSAAEYGLPAPTEDAAGFVCSIYALPAGAGPGHCPKFQDYWSLWTRQPGGAWQYASTGAYDTAAVSGVEEGWSYTTAKGTPAPPADLTEAQVCASASPSSAPTTTAPAGHPTPTGTRTTSSSPSLSPAPRVTTAPAPSARSTAAGSHGGGMAPTAGAAAAALAGGSTPSTATGSRAAVAPDGGPSPAPGVQLLTTHQPQASSTSPARSAPVGAIAGIVVAAAMVAGGMFVSRRRRARPEVS